MVKPRVHARARGSHPAYPPRAWVPIDKISWKTPYPSYAPVPFTHACVIIAAVDTWADQELRSMPVNVHQALPTRRTTSGRKLSTLKAIGAIWPGGVPRNPVGRTGICGRGLLGRFGANCEADPIVTRRKPGASDVLQMVAITRRDTAELAIPGGMVDRGDTVSATIVKEFKEEALRQNEGNGKMTADLQTELDAVFASGGDLVYSGYVDDPRNTDEAWIESEVRHFHLDDALGAKLPLEAGDDAAMLISGLIVFADVAWVDITPNMQLYASHKSWVDVVNKRARMRRFA